MSKVIVMPPLRAIKVLAITVFLISFVIVCVFIFKTTLKSAYRAASYSELASIASAIATELDGKNPSVISFFDAPTGGGRSSLLDEEVNSLINLIDEIHPLDFARSLTGSLDRVIEISYMTSGNRITIYIQTTLHEKSSEHQLISEIERMIAW